MARELTPPTPRLTPIEELNRLPRGEFAAAIRPLFEAAAPLADGLFAGRPYLSYDELLDRAEAIVARLPAEQQVAVINAHPRIGESAELVRQSSALSYREQGYDREAAIEQEELARVYRELAELNRAYEARFGFRFVVFVNRRPKSEIVEAMKARLGNTREQEAATALGEMLLIARDRFRSLRAAGQAER